jgi:hypothetical protein
LWTGSPDADFASWIDAQSLKSIRANNKGVLIGGTEKIYGLVRVGVSYNLPGHIALLLSISVS